VHRGAGGRGGPFALYDIDTPETLRNSRRGCREHVTQELIRRYQSSFFHRRPVCAYREPLWIGRLAARAFFLIASVRNICPEPGPTDGISDIWALYSDDRKPVLESMMLGRSCSGVRAAVRWWARVCIREASVARQCGWEVHLSRAMHSGVFTDRKRFT